MPSRKAKIEVPASLAVLAAIKSGARTTPEIGKIAGMTTKSVASTVARLKKKELVRRSNPRAKRAKPGVKGAVAKYTITRAGGTHLRRALKKMGVK
jgi:DNA-binding CsgD family transcriptional regulator